jgi:hypothetical protein
MSKIIYSTLFILILSLIRGISMVEDIGVAMDSTVALLAIIFCADTYYQEIQGIRWEVFGMLSKNQRYKTICQRLFIQFGFIIVLIAIGFWMFYLQKPSQFSETSLLFIYSSAVFACSASAVFFGTLSFTMINVCKNLWAGIGSSVLIWLTLNSTLGRKIPAVINVFAYGNATTLGEPISFYIGKMFAIFVMGLLLVLNKYLLDWKRKERV